MTSFIDDIVHRWPYARGLLLQAPDPKMIEGHAFALLSRALNIGRVTAFVGSGASAAYGRIGWHELLREVQDTVLERYDTSQSKTSNLQATRIRALLEDIKIKQDDDLEVSTQLAVFQLSEELDRALLSASKSHDPLVPTLRDSVMWLTADERGYIEKLLIDTFLDLLDPVNKFSMLDVPKNSWPADYNPGSPTDLEKQHVKKSSTACFGVRTKTSHPAVSHRI